MTIDNTLDQPEVTDLLFPLPRNKQLPPCPSVAEDIVFNSQSGKELSCRFYLKSQDAPIIFFFPATDDEAQDVNKLAQNYLDHGMNFFLASYTGCGGNGGLPSVSSLFSDSREIFQLTTEWLAQNNHSGSIFVMGQGLGSVCAVEIVASNSEQVKGMILESVVFTTNGFLKALGFEKIEVEESTGFNVIEKIETIKHPTLIFHGARDSIVKISDAENLQASSGARTKQFFVIPGAERHTVSQTGGELYFQSIKKFIDTVCGVNTWRQKRRKHKNSQQE